MIVRVLYFNLLLLSITTLISCSHDSDLTQPDTPGQPTIDWAKAADSSSQSLVNNFYNTQGNYFNSQNTGLITLSFNTGRRRMHWT